MTLLTSLKGRIEYDPKENAVCLYLKHPTSLGAAQRTLPADQDRLYLDFGDNGTPLGSEIPTVRVSLGVTEKSLLEEIVEATKLQITAAMQSNPQDASLYQRALELLQ